MTLYHWDLPQELEDAGGWPARDTAYRFADYARAGARRAGRPGAVTGPRSTSRGARRSSATARARTRRAGRTAPPRCAPRTTSCSATGWPSQALRAAGTQWGITLNLYAISPATPSAEDADAARRIDGLANRIFLDPVLRGAYPADVVADLAGVTDMAHVRDGDLAVSRTPVDVLGINYYSRHVVGAARPDGAAPSRTGGRRPRWPGSEDVRFVTRGLPVTEMGWEIDAPGLVEMLTRVARASTRRVPLYITENGAAFPDEAVDGEVADPARIAYLDAHLRACHDRDRGRGAPAGLLRLVTDG